DVLRQLPVPFLSDWTMVHIVAEDGSIRFVPGVHADPAKVPLVAAVGSRESRLDSRSHLGKVIATGRAVVLTMTVDDASSLIGPNLSGSVLEQLGLGTVAMLPLIAEGRVKGVLSLVCARPRRFISSESLVIHDIVRRISLALDRIQLY